VVPREVPRAPVSAGIEYVASLEQACALAVDAPELCVIGGAAVFALVLPRTTRLYLTAVHASVEGDTWFPLHALHGWRETARLEHPVDARHAHAMSFLTLEREPS
jgi:dihydrofolate reductase